MPDALRRSAVFLIPALLCATALIQADSLRRSSSITYDETFYLREGELTLRGGGLDVDLMNLGVAPLPIAVNMVPGLWLAGVDPNHDAYAPEPGNRRLIDAPRLLTTCTTLLPLILLAFGWLHARRGLTAAAAGAAMLAASPSLLAHASLATTDAAFAFLATLAALAIGLSLRSPGRTRLLIAATATGLAFSAKYTGILLIPCYVAARSLDFLRVERSHSVGRARRVGKLAGDLAAFGAMAFLVAWACHGFQLAPGSHLPGFFKSFSYQIEHNKLGHPSFYLGERSRGGWWSYYPFTLLAKSTIPELILAAGGLAVALAAVVRGGLSGLATDRERATMLWFGLATAVALVASPICIGHRYTLALYPIIILLSVDAMAGAIRRPGLRLGLAAMLIAGQAVTSLTAAPEHLAYFNPIFGGPEAAWRQLADSNLDWGQDLPALGKLLDDRGLRSPILDYFGTASPSDYGIRADSPDSLRGSIEHYDALAVSITKLHSVYAKRAPGWPAPDVYRRLRDIPPTYRAGRSIFVYNLREPGVRDALAAAIEAAQTAEVERQAASEASVGIRR